MGYSNHKAQTDHHYNCPTIYEKSVLNFLQDVYNLWCGRCGISKIITLTDIFSDSEFHDASRQTYNRYVCIPLNSLKTHLHLLHGKYSLP